MTHFSRLTALALAFLLACAATAQNPIPDPPQEGDRLLQVTAPELDPGYRIILQAFTACDPTARPLSRPLEITRDTRPGDKLPLLLVHKLQAKESVCVAAEYRPLRRGSVLAPRIGTKVSGPVPVVEKEKHDNKDASNPCSRAFNDCNWGYTAVAGAEQSGTSAQNSQTNAFVDLFVRSPRAAKGGSIWAELRFLGAPSNSNTQGVVAAATDPTGSVSSSSISTVGTAVDYIVGYQWDFPHKNDRPFSFGLIGAFGATTPLSSQSASIAYAIPAFGTNECTQLLGKFGTAGNYSPQLPGSGAITTTTQVTTGGSSTTSTSTSPTYCSVNPVTNFSVASLAGTTVTTTTNGVQITTVAFSPADRSSFLLKYIGGIRFIDRQRPKGTGTCHGDHADSWTDNCSRSMTDFTVGQDQAITGGLLRHLVFKANTQFRIPNTFVFLYASAAIRAEHNRNQAPLILSQVPIVGSGSTATGAVTIPSPSVFVLPLRQSDRDFYRFGIAVDLTKVLPKLFAAPPDKPADGK